MIHWLSDGGSGSFGDDATGGSIMVCLAGLTMGREGIGKGETQFERWKNPNFRVTRRQVENIPI
jgi:hypothetical protein